MDVGVQDRARASDLVRERERKRENGESMHFGVQNKSLEGGVCTECICENRIDY